MLGRIAIHLSDDDACERRINIGLMLAKAHGAEVVGIYPVDTILQKSYDETVIPYDVRRNLIDLNERHRESVHQIFTQHADSIGVKAHWRIPGGAAEKALALHARYCDMLIMSKPARRDRGVALVPDLPESVMMTAGRPVLMIPNTGTFKSIGKNILFCWNQSREAARAFADAAPLLKQCNELTVLEIDRDHNQQQENDIHADDFKNYCVALGYPVPRSMTQGSGPKEVGKIILSTAEHTNSDMIVMGVYGHSRMREWVMSGASRTVLESMAIPVLLAH